MVLTNIEAQTYVRVCSATSSSQPSDRQQACVCIVCLSNINEAYTHTHTIAHTHRGLRGQRVSQSSKPLRRHSLKKGVSVCLFVCVWVCIFMVCVCVCEQGAGSCQGLGAAGTNEADE